MLRTWFCGPPTLASACDFNHVTFNFVKNSPSIVLILFYPLWGFYLKKKSYSNHISKKLWHCTKSRRNWLLIHRYVWISIYIHRKREKLHLTDSKVPWLIRCTVILHTIKKKKLPFIISRHNFNYKMCPDFRPYSNHKKASDKAKLKDIAQNNWPVFFKSVKVIKG